MPEQTQLKTTATDHQVHDDFMRHYSQAYLAIYTFTLTLVPVVSDADDIMQQTSLVLWQKFSQFEKGSSFIHWAQQIARFEVQSYRRKFARDRHVFADDVLEALATEHSTDSVGMEDERSALVECLKHIPADERVLLQSCYSGEAALKQIAERRGRTPTSLYKWLNRIRESLLHCVERRTMETRRV